MNKKLTRIDAVLKRLCETLKCKNDTELAKALNVGRTTVSSWRTRESVPYAECVNVALREQVSLDYLLTGRGYPKNVTAIEDDANVDAYYNVSKNELRDVTKRVIDVARSRKKFPDIMKLGRLRDFALYKKLTDADISLVFDLLENADEIYQK